MTRIAALPLAILLALAGPGPFAAAETTAAPPAPPPQATPIPPATPAPSADDRIEAVETRMKVLEEKLDRILGSLDAQKAAATPAAGSGVTAGAAASSTGAAPADGPAIAPATPAGTAATQLQPGWVARTFPLARFPLEKSGDVLSAFVLPESTFHLDDHVRHSMIPKSTKVAYELTGFLDVTEAGEHSLGLLIDEGGRGNCAARASIENQTVFEDDKITGADKAFDPLIGTAKLDAGLYEVRIWIACSNSGSKPLRVRVISRTPSMSAPDVLPATSIGHKEL